MNQMPESSDSRWLCRRVGLFSVVFIAFAFVYAAPARYAYLPTVGAPALRIGSAASTNSFSFLAFNQELPAIEAKAAESLSNLTALASNNGGDTNKIASVSSTNSSPTASTAVAAPAPESTPTATQSKSPVYLSASSPPQDIQQNPAASPYNFNFPGSAASDLLSVTPQMITQYLKPDANETNQLDRHGVSVFVPVTMPFVPPTQAATPESRAIYQSR